MGAKKCPHKDKDFGFCHLCGDIYKLVNYLHNIIYCIVFFLTKKEGFCEISGYKCFPQNMVKYRRTHKHTQYT